MLAPISSEQVRTSDYELIVNCTAVGLAGDESDPFEALPLDPARLHGVALVDLVYGHNDTELVRRARELGADVIDGVEVLIRQGAESLRIWTGEGSAAGRDARSCAAEPPVSETLKLTPSESVIIRRAEPSVLEVEGVYGPGGSPPPKHLHPEQDERFRVIAGTADDPRGRLRARARTRRAARDPARRRPPDVEPGRRGGARLVGDAAGRAHRAVVPRH